MYTQKDAIYEQLYQLAKTAHRAVVKNYPAPGQYTVLGNEALRQQHLHTYESFNGFEWQEEEEMQPLEPLFQVGLTYL